MRQGIFFEILQNLLYLKWEKINSLKTGVLCVETMSVTLSMESPQSKGCAACVNKVTEPVKCTKCKLAIYCTRACMHRDWDHPNGKGWHSVICPLLKDKKHTKLSGKVADVIAFSLKEVNEQIIDQIRVLKREFTTRLPKKTPVLYLRFRYQINEIINVMEFTRSLKMWIESNVFSATHAILKAQGRDLLGDEAEEFMRNSFTNKRLELSIVEEESIGIPLLTKTDQSFLEWHNKVNLPCVIGASLDGNDTSVDYNRFIIVVKDCIPEMPKPAAPSTQAPDSTTPTSEVSKEKTLRKGLVINHAGAVIQSQPLDVDEEGCFAHYMGFEEISGVGLGGIEGYSLSAFFDSNYDIKKLPFNTVASYLGQTKQDNLYGSVLLIDDDKDLTVEDLKGIIKLLETTRKAIRAKAKTTTP